MRRSLSVGGVRLSYLEHGAARAGEPTLLMLHGLVGTAATFEPLLEALPAERHAVAMDLPGNGFSERGLHVNPALSVTAEIVLQACDALGLVRPVPVGHSHGGAVSLCLGGRHPERLGGVVLLAPAHPYFRQADGLIAFYLSPLGRFLAHAAPWAPQWVQMVGLRYMAGPQSRDNLSHLAPYRENLRTRGTVGHLLRLLRSWQTDMAALRDLLEGGFPSPALLLWGDHDRAVPLESARELLDRLPRAELKVLPGTGHRPAEEQPEVCARAIEDWLARTALVGTERFNGGR